MKTILKSEMRLDRLQQLFHSEGCEAQLLGNSLAPQDSYLRVDFPEPPPLIVWFDDLHLRMRVLVASNEERDQLDFELLNEDALGVNQNIEYFGTLNPGGLTGITIDYRLPCSQGILEVTVMQAAKEMVQGGANYRKMLNFFCRKK